MANISKKYTLTKSFTLKLLKYIYIDICKYKTKIFLYFFTCISQNLAFNDISFMYKQIHTPTISSVGLFLHHLRQAVNTLVFFSKARRHSYSCPYNLPFGKVGVETHYHPIHRLHLYFSPSSNRKFFLMVQYPTQKHRSLVLSLIFVKIELLLSFPPFSCPSLF